MRGLTCFLGGLVLLPLTVSLSAQGAATDLTHVKALYADASYDEALAELAKIDTASWSEQVDEYRALCLLALGRTREAEQVLEHLVRLKPLHSVPEDQLSPRVVSLYKTVRWRTMPSVAREVYANAKRAYEAGRFDDAAGQFRQLAEILSDADLLEQGSNLADLKELGEGFLKLAEAEAKLHASRAVPAQPSQPMPPPPGQFAAGTPRVFTIDDHDITPPVEIERRVPEWTRSSGATVGELRGLLEVVIDTDGAIESAKLVKPLSPLYDRELLAAAKRWKYRPAMKGSEPVKYRWLMEIVLKSR
jgi:TonB-like protein